MDTHQEDFSPGMITDRYSSVEISIGKAEPAYLFRIRNIPAAGVGILVKEGSAILRHLRVGETLNLKYNPFAASDLPEYLETEIKYIREYDQTRPCKHYLINLAVLAKEATTA